MGRLMKTTVESGTEFKGILLFAKKTQTWTGGGYSLVTELIDRPDLINNDASALYTVAKELSNDQDPNYLLISKLLASGLMQQLEAKVEIDRVQFKKFVRFLGTRTLLFMVKASTVVPQENQFYPFWSDLLTEANNQMGGGLPSIPTNTGLEDFREGDGKTGLIE